MTFDFNQARNQSPKGLILIFLQESIKIVRTLWPVFLWAVVGNDKENKWMVVVWILAGLAVIALIHTILWFRFFKFKISDNQFILFKGYLNKKTLSIPLERIQNVETNQSVLQKMLGVMGLEIDTAGTDKKELKISSLTAPMAVELARSLSKNVSKKSESDTAQDQNIVKEELVLRLSNRDLLRIGISQNHLRAGLIILAFGHQIFEQISDLFEEKAKEYSSELLDFLGHSGWVILVMVVLLFAAVSFLYSMIRTLLLFYDLRFMKSESGYRIVSGLLNRKNILIRYSKIQQINWETGPLKKLFGIYRINIRQASGDRNTRKQTIELPGVLAPHLDMIKTDLFGEDTLSNQPVLKVHPRYFYRNWLILGLLPGIVISSFVWQDWYYPVIGVFWMLLITWMEVIRSRKTGFLLNPDQLRSKGGTIATKWKQMELHKVQQVKFTQSFFQRRRNLASLKINNASGSIRIPYIEQQLAKSLHDYLLYYAESSMKPWM